MTKFVEGIRKLSYEEFDEITSEGLTYKLSALQGSSSGYNFIELSGNNLIFKSNPRGVNFAKLGDYPELDKYFIEYGPEDESSASSQDDLKTKIYNACLQLGGYGPKRIRISELHKLLGNISKSDIDKTLIQLQNDGTIVLLTLDNPAEKYPSDDSVAVDIVGEKRHILYVVGPLKTTASKKRGAGMLKELFKLAHDLDKKGLYDEANIIDEMIKSKKANISPEEIIDIADYFDSIGETILANQFDDLLKEAEAARRAPKAWWDEKEKEVKKGNPSYSAQKLSETIGSIWNNLSDAERERIFKRHGKTKSPNK
jgi:hypothetical protein